MLLSFVRLPHPAGLFAAVEFDVRGGRRERGRVRMGERKKKETLYFTEIQVQ